MRSIVILAALSVASLAVVPLGASAQEVTPTPEWDNFKSTKTRAQVRAEAEQAKAGAPKPADDKDKTGKPAEPKK